MKSFISTICILGLVGMVVGVAVQGATEGTVTATVSVQNISVTVTDGTVAYGTLAASASKDTTAVVGGLDDTQVATNNGNVTENLNIRGQNSAPAGWVLAATAGANQYAQKFCKTGTGAPDPCDTAPTWTALTTSNQTLTAGVAATGTQRFDLQILVPSSSSDFNQQAVDVTVQATAS